MTEDQLEQVFELTERISNDIHALLIAELSGVDPEVEELVRTKLGEEFRFWARYERTN